MNGVLAVGGRIEVRVTLEENLRLQILVARMGGTDVDVLDTVVLPRENGAESVAAVLVGGEAALVVRGVDAGAVRLADVDGRARDRLAVDAAHPAADAQRLAGIAGPPEIQGGRCRRLGAAGGECRGRRQRAHAEAEKQAEKHAAAVRSAGNPHESFLPGASLVQAWCRSYLSPQPDGGSTIGQALLPEPRHR